MEFADKGNTYIAKWEHIRKFQRLENKNFVKMSKLTNTASNPKPIERQKIDTCLKVICEKTINALMDDNDNDNVDGTVIFISKLIEF